MGPADSGDKHDEDGPRSSEAPVDSARAGVTVTDVLLDPPESGAAPLHVHLIISGVGAQARIVDLEDGKEVSFGRTPESTIVIDDPRVSRRHALVRRNGAAVVVCDLGSRNGTKVRRETLRGQEKLVGAGDILGVGPAQVVVAAVTRGGPAQEAPPASRREAVQEPAAISDALAYDGIVVADPAMQKIFRLARRLGQAPTTVLIAGETGVGKEVVAEQIHRWSPRASGPFVRLNCASLADTLLESELFGYEKGAFTGADRRKLGFVEAADGGTLLLDEIGEMPLTLQAKLLRVLETKRVVRLGGTAETTVDVRFVCATHRNLKQDVAAGRFREDLYYRISTFTLQVPALRDRPAEITLLAEVFASHLARRMDLPTPTIDISASEALLRHPWPGNVRELRNAIEHAVVMAEEGVIRAEHLPDSIQSPASPAPIESARVMKAQFFEFERKNLEAALAAENGNQTRAAKRLGITRRMLIYKMAKLGVRSKPPAT